MAFPPGQVNMLRIDGGANYIDIPFGKFFEVLIKRYDFGWANKSKVEWIKEKYYMFFTDILGEREFFDKFATIDYGICLKLRRFFVKYRYELSYLPSSSFSLEIRML